MASSGNLRKLGISARASSGSESLLIRFASEAISNEWSLSSSNRNTVRALRESHGRQRHVRNFVLSEMYRFLSHAVNVSSTQAPFHVLVSLRDLRISAAKQWSRSDENYRGRETYDRPLVPDIFRSKTAVTSASDRHST